ncbi:uncharacterized protein LOC110465523 isoform X2 [Mizuhopecten yessoensis]|uniref:uncharacterized protein LOC110465523 isoform X2 n=1 Tax=Mizuhopecten yessoensis TaxID=6573 RepID=UPI000B45949A|nr:uncharacterized protein LOC110465523 isoform X2 [Mizuhopecten yessoensis]
MDRCIFAVILVITIAFSYPSGTHGAFSDIQRRAKMFCSLAFFNDAEDTNCDVKGVSVEATDFVQSGTPKLRVKRGWLRRRRRRRYTPPPPPPNRPPTITCPTVNSEYSADSRTKVKTVTWGTATATDPENNPVTITQTHGWVSGSLFTEGHYSLGYIAKDSYGNADVCSEQFEIKVRRCTRMPPRPTNGEISCEPDWYDPLLGSTCSFSCDDGYSLAGSTLRTCQSDGTFDGIPAVCSKITCPDLPIPANGQATCIDGNNYKSVCMTSCPVQNGYGSVGTFILCRYDGSWSGSLQPCYDFRAPYFTECPPSPIKSYADKGQNSASVTWSSLNATDNSGDVTIVRTLGAAPGSEFSVGSHLISYVARDASGNQSPTTCSFTVVVEQLECDPPNGLFDDELLQVDCPGSEYTFGIECSLSCVRNYTIIGNTTLTCEREGTTTKASWDWGGGAQPECDDKCPVLTPPIDGALVCTTAANYYCRQSCNANSGYPRGTVAGQLFICTTDQLWDPPAVDDCTGRKVPDSNIISGEMHYFVGDCNDPAVQEGLRANFITVLEDLISDGWNSVCSSSGCSVDNVEVTCGALSGRKKKSLRGVLQVKSFEHSRYRRSSFVIKIDFSVTFPWQNGTSDDDLTANDNLLYDVMATLEEEAKKSGGLFEYGGLTPSPDIVTDPYPMITCPTGESPSYVGGGVNCEGCATGKYFDSVVGDCTVCPIGTYQDESHQTTCKACPTDMSTKDTGRKKIGDCFQVCGAGTYSNKGVIPCTKCAIGTYQSAKHRTACTSCDVAKTTVSRGAESSSACIAFDVIFGSPGTNIAFPSFTASLNAFSLMFWLKCPAGSVITPTIHLVNSIATAEVLKITDSQTLEMFGTAYTITLDNWKHVTITWEETTGQAKLLINGENNASVAVTGNIATAGTRVEITSNNGYIADCRLSGFRLMDTKRSDAQIKNDMQTCTPDATGAIYSMDNFKNQDGVILDTPSKCDVVDECAALPCGVHDCENLLNTYKCICMGGYTGVNCDTAPDFCLNNTCKNSAICQSQAWNYTCQCVGDFRGELCEENIVHGQWAKWSDWNRCTVTCSVSGSAGQQNRNRTCSDPPPGTDGNECSGSDQEVQACNLEQCPSCKPIELLLLGARKTITDHCETEGDYTRCNLTCETGYGFTSSTPPLEYYECGQNTSHEWNSRQLPSCGSIRRGRSITIRTSATYTDTLSCGSSTDTALQSSAGNAQCMLDSTCDVTVTTDTCGKRRRKRTTGTTVDMSFVFNLENIGDLNLTAFLESNIISAELQAYLNVLSESDDTADQINSTSEAFFNVVINGNTYTIDPDTFMIESQTTCDNGSIDDDGGCVECPTGTRQDGAWCVLCEVGTYQNESGQALCKQCPTGFTTEFVGMLLEENCSVNLETTTGTTSLSTSSATSTITTTTTATSTTTTPTTTTTTPTTTTTTTPTTTMPTTTTTTPTTTTTATTHTTTTTTPKTTPSLSTATTTPTTTTKTSIKRKFPPNVKQSEGLTLVSIIMIGVLATLLIISAVLAGGLFIYRKRKPVRTTSPTGNQHRGDINVNVRLHSNIPNTVTVAEAGLPPPYTNSQMPPCQKGALPPESVFMKPLPRKSAF